MKATWFLAAMATLASSGAFAQAVVDPATLEVRTRIYGVLAEDLRKTAPVELSPELQAALERAFAPMVTNAPEDLRKQSSDGTKVESTKTRVAPALKKNVLIPPTEIAPGVFRTAATDEIASSTEDDATTFWQKLALRLDPTGQLDSFIAIDASGDAISQEAAHEFMRGEMRLMRQAGGQFGVASGAGKAAPGLIESFDLAPRSIRVERSVAHPTWTKVTQKQWLLIPVAKLKLISADCDLNDKSGKCVSLKAANLALAIQNDLSSQAAQLCSQESGEVTSMKKVTGEVTCLSLGIDQARAIRDQLVK